MERRRKPRITTPFPVKVRGKDSFGHEISEETTVVNLSTGGVYFQLLNSICEGTQLRVGIGLPAGALVAVQGVVKRVDSLGDGSHGVAVMIESYHV